MSNSSRDEKRRHQLLDAALQVYATTVQAVCRQAHVSTRSFYELYADKFELRQGAVSRTKRTGTAGLLR